MRQFHRVSIWAFAAAFSIALVSFSSAEDQAGKLKLNTTAFRAGAAIPPHYTCSGENSSPFLFWTPPPVGTRSFVLIVDDPDAPGRTWVHWVVYDLPATARQLPEDVPLGETIAGGGKQGINDFPTNGYGGPCPPPGKPHHYFFRLYALDAVLALHSSAQRQEVDKAMKGHILAQTELVGTYKR